MRRGKQRVLTDDERRLVRDAVREHNRLEVELREVEERLLDLMDRRDEIMAEMAPIQRGALAVKFEVDPSVITYVCRPRKGRHEKDDVRAAVAAARSGTRRRPDIHGRVASHA